MKKNLKNKEGGFIKQILLLLILIALIFFGYGAYQNIRENRLNKANIKDGITKTIDAQKEKVEETTDQLIEESKKTLAQRIKEKISEIIDDIFGLDEEKENKE